MEDQNQTEDMFAGYGEDVGELSQAEIAEQQYLKQSGVLDAIAAGLAEGLTLGWSDEIQGAYDKFLGRAGEEGYVSPERRTELLKAESPIAYGAGDITGTMATGFIPVPGVQAGTAAKLAARFGAPAVMGGLEAAGKAKEGERLSAIPVGMALGAGGAKLGEMAGAAMSKAGAKSRLKREVPLEEKTRPLAKEARGIEQKISSLQEGLLQKELAPKQQAIEKAIKQQEQAQKSIFDIQEEMGALAGKEMFLGDISQQQGLRQAIQDIKQRVAGRADLEKRAADLEKQIAVAEQAPSEMAMNVLMADIRKQMGDLAEETGVLQRQVAQAKRGEAAPARPVFLEPFEQTPFAGVAAQQAEQAGRLQARQLQAQAAKEGESKAVAKLFEELQRLMKEPVKATGEIATLQSQRQSILEDIGKIKQLSESDRKTIEKLIEDPATAKALEGLLRGAGVTTAGVIQ